MSDVDVEQRLRIRRAARAIKAKRQGNAGNGTIERAEYLRKALASGTLIDRKLPKPVRILGDVVTATSRIFLVGPTGAGKTMLGLGMAVGAASGRGFLHWNSESPFRVLYIDGEMPLDLLQERLRDELQRVGNASATVRENLFIYTMDTAEEVAAIDPDLGAIDPLNTQEGQAFVRTLAELIEPKLIIFDNVQSLVAGVQKEEETWSPVGALVQWLSSRQIGQIWIDHTARSTGAQYGTSTKSWRFDAVMVITPLAEDQKVEGDALACGLTFDKARRAKPSNRTEFESQTVRLTDGVWTSEATAARTASVTSGLSTRLRQYHRCLLDAITVAMTGRGETTRGAWLSECIRTGLVAAAAEGDTRREKDDKVNRFRRALQQLREAGVIGVDGERVIDLSQKYR